jgi:hypothetical protein
VVVLALAAVPRAAWYNTHHPDLPPDAYGYLNVAREWRGERAPDYAWDDRSQLPANNEAARTPGYPLFLNLVFALSGHSPTPESALAGPRKVLAPGVGTGARARHLEHLRSDENVRAVQAAQHILAVAATGLAFFTLVQWTGSAPASITGSLVGIGWNPVWIVTLEPSVMTETLAGVLLVAIVWLVSMPQRATVCVGAAAALCGVDAVVRPAMLISAAPVLAYLLWRERHHVPRVLAVVMAPALVIALLIVNNGLRYHYWGITSVTGTTFLSHANDHPDGLREPVRGQVERHRPYLIAGSSLQYVIAVKNHRSYLDVKREVDAAALGYVIDHPAWYLASVGKALVNFLSPPLRYVPGGVNRIRQRFPAAWHVLSAAVMLLLLAGTAALFTRVPDAARLAPAIFLVSAVGTSMLAHTENPRFAAPIVPLVLMSGVAVVHGGLRRFAGPAGSQ